VDTRFAIASGTKGLTALTVVSLISDDVLKLETPAREWLGEDLPLIGDDVTVEHLLSHRSGIGDYCDEDDQADISEYHPPVAPDELTTVELKTLRAVERIPQNRPNNKLYNGRYQVATYQEILDLTKHLSRELHRTVGTYPEVKHSTYFQSIGMPTEPKLVDILKRNGLNRPDAPVAIQSFEVSNLIELHKQLRVPMLQLTSATGAPADFVAKGDKRTYADLVTPQGLREVAKYAKFLGPDKSQIIPRDAAGNLAAPTSLVHDAHAAGLVVQPYTFRNENPFLPTNLRSSADPAAFGDVFSEEAAFFKAGVDGFFADQPDTALESLHAFLGR